MCVRARFPPISGEVETSLVEGQSNGHDWSSGIKTREKNGRKLSRGGKRGRGEGEGEKKERKIGKVGNRWLSLMRSLPGEWKQEKLRTGGGTTRFSIDTR